MPSINAAKQKISAGIICKNAAATIEKTLKSLTWVNDIIIIDDHSVDVTVDIAKRFTQHITTSTADSSFAEKRNQVLKELDTEWIVYIDSDEVVTSELQQEISQIVERGEPGVFSINRQNYFLGTQMYADRVDRLFHRSVISEWTGAVHESPQVNTPKQQLHAPLLHYTHTDIHSMLEKTNQWSNIEADLRLAAHHPPMAWWRLVRIAVTELWQQFVGKKVGKYGRAGKFEGYFQMVDKLIVYTKLWEKQQ